ncbi:MAG: hypothetical protein WCA22_00695 [Candidatus Binatus sp.]
MNTPGDEPTKSNGTDEQPAPATALDLFTEYADTLLERAAARDALGALREGLRRIGGLVSENPHFAPAARQLLDGAAEKLLALVSVGAGNQIAQAMLKICAEIPASGPRPPYKPTIHGGYGRAPAGQVKAVIHPSGISYINDKGEVVREKHYGSLT